MEEWNWILATLAVLGGLFFVSVIVALVWAVKSGQFSDMDAGSRVIFDNDEPEGEQTDFFPGESDEARVAIKSAEEKKRNQDDDLING